MEQTSLAKSSKEGYGSKRTVLPIMMVLMIWYSYAGGKFKYPYKFVHVLNQLSTMP
jgi:hypothetical protein